MTITGIIWHCFTVFGKRCVMADTFQMSTKDQCEKNLKILEEIFQEYTRLNNKEKRKNKINDYICIS